MKGLWLFWFALSLVCPLISTATLTNGMVLLRCLSSFSYRSYVILWAPFSYLQTVQRFLWKVVRHTQTFGQVDKGLKYTQSAIDRDPYFIIAKLNNAKTLMQVRFKILSLYFINLMHWKMLICHVYIGNRFQDVIGWLVVFRIYVASAVFQPYRDLEAGNNKSLNFKWRGGESKPGLMLRKPRV